MHQLCSQAVQHYHFSVSISKLIQLFFLLWQDLVKNHLMYAVREEVEVLKEQIKELAEKNNQLERENYLLKNLASPEQLEKFQSRIPTDTLLPLDNVSSQVTADQPCSLSTGSAV